MAFSRACMAEKGHGMAVTAVAIGSDRNSQFAVRWAVENLINAEAKPLFVLVHVQGKPYYPDSYDFDTASRESHPPSEQELQLFFLPYRGFCARKGIEAKQVVLYDSDLTNALIDFTRNNPISNLVVGASTRNALTRKIFSADVPSRLLKSLPESCAFYVISKGKVQACRTAPIPHVHVRHSVDNDEAFSMRIDDPMRMENSSPKSSCSGDGSGRASCDRQSDSLQISPDKTASGHGNKTLPSFISMEKDRHHSRDILNIDSMSDTSDLWQSRSHRSTDSSECLSSDSMSFGCPEESNALEEELRRLKLELKQSEEMYNSVFKEATLAKQMAKELRRLQTLGECKLREAKLAEEAALALAQAEWQKSRAAIEAAELAHRLAEMEARKRMDAEMRVRHEVDENKRLLKTLKSNTSLYRRYSINDIEVATNYFASSNQIGEGGYGPVYKGELNHTAVAIKVLRPNLSKGERQFKQEVEILSTIRHPHLVMLVGACPEYGSLVYEYMDNGSLEDRLLRKHDTPPIPWQTRFAIASEIATALLFLHETKPEPLVHRDLKPANILLDRNFVSKIGDVGLARLIPSSVDGDVSQCHLTGAAGTLNYIDPEYQQSGKLDIKSDLYSFGVMLLQIITAKHPLGLSLLVNESIANGTFSDMLDPTVTDWPDDVALSFAKLALQCCELRKNDRPDLASVVLPELNRLRDVALAYESEKPEEKVPLPLDSGNSQVQPKTCQINARTKWHWCFKSLSKLASFKSVQYKNTSISLTAGNQTIGRSKTSNNRGFWSLIASCSSSRNLVLQ